jgi:hypothetical protein
MAGLVGTVAVADDSCNFGSVVIETRCRWTCSPGTVAGHPASADVAAGPHDRDVCTHAARFGSVRWPRRVKTAIAEFES